jgi:hypothetical protein
MMAASRIIDCHIHCGVQQVSWPWEKVRARLQAARINGAGLIPPVEDIYDRRDYNFQDTPDWQECRRRAQHYLLSLQDPDFALYPYFFVWNDFAWEELTPAHAGIKWHRHDNEPEYHYDDPRCREFLDRVMELRLPILLEETLDNTLYFIRELAPAATVIIPHLGLLNGGYSRLAAAGIWQLPRVFADTALAGTAEVRSYLQSFGHERLLFGSDYPFGDPVYEKEKILSLDLPEAVNQAILAGNWLRLLAARPEERAMDRLSS